MVWRHIGDAAESVLRGLAQELRLRDLNPQSFRCLKNGSLATGRDKPAPLPMHNRVGCDIECAGHGPNAAELVNDIGD